MLSDSAIINVGSAALAAISTSFIAYVAFMTKRMERRADLDAIDRCARSEQDAYQRKMALIAVEAMKAKLAESTSASAVKLESIAQVSRDTHRIVNGAMAIQLRLNAKLSRRLADLTGDPADVRIADEAERLLAEHEKNLLSGEFAEGPESSG